MTTWILILVMQSNSAPGGSNNPGSAAMSAVFQSQQSCEKAAAKIEKDKKSWNGSFNVYCFENSAAPGRSAD